MFRNKKKQLIFSSLAILFPIAVGLILWDRLPETLTTHWGFDGQADGWSALPIAVFVPPLLILAAIGSAFTLPARIRTIWVVTSS